MFNSKMCKAVIVLCLQKRLHFFTGLLGMACVMYYIQSTLIASNNPIKYHENNHENFSDYRVVTRRFTNPLTIYNRVSKCGSSTMIWIGKQLSSRHRFHFRSESKPFMNMSFSEIEKMKFAKRVSMFRKNTLFVRHFHFVDFQKYGGIDPVYINVVRDPVDRFISRFYYRRFGFTQRKKLNSHWPRKHIPPETINMTLEECVFGGVEDCIKEERHKPIFTFFCDDHSPKCGELTSYSLNNAVKNAAQHYAAIGLTEDLDTTLKVFEALLPRYFEGAPELLPLCPETSRTKSKNRKETSQEVKAILREALRIEVEFYEFVKERFYRQVDELKKLGRMK